MDLKVMYVCLLFLIVYFIVVIGVCLNLDPYTLDCLFPHSDRTYTNKYLQFDGFHQRILSKLVPSKQVLAKMFHQSDSIKWNLSNGFIKLVPSNGLMHKCKGRCWKGTKIPNTHKGNTHTKSALTWKICVMWRGGFLIEYSWDGQVECVELWHL